MFLVTTVNPGTTAVAAIMASRNGWGFGTGNAALRQAATPSMGRIRSTKLGATGSANRERRSAP